MTMYFQDVQKVQAVQLSVKENRILNVKVGVVEAAVKQNG